MPFIVLPMHQQARVVNYVAQYTKEMAEATSVLTLLNAGHHPKHVHENPESAKRFKVA